MPNEIVFVVEEDPEGGWCARAVGLGIVTQGDSLDTLHETIRDALHCHYPAAGDQRHPEHPKRIRLHHLRQEVIES